MSDLEETLAPWTRNQLIRELKGKGWTRLGGAGSTYVSPDDRDVHFHLDTFRVGIGILWRYFAERHELPATTPPPF